MSDAPSHTDTRTVEGTSRGSSTRVTLTRVAQVCFCATFFVVLCFMGVMTARNEEQVSDTENRYLAQWPVLSVHALVDGTYTENLSLAFNDQLFKRQDLTTLYYTLFMDTYSNMVVKGSDNQLFAAPFFVTDQAAKDASLREVSTDVNEVANEVTSAGAEFIFLSIPRKDAVMTEYLPKSYTNSDTEYTHSLSVLERNLNQNVRLIDALPLLTQTPDKNGRHDYYLTTDHHMNVRGGELLYNVLMDDIQKEFPGTPRLALDRDYNIREVVVNGSFDRQIGQTVKAAPEELNLALKNPHSVASFVRTENGEPSDIKVYGSGNTYASAYMGGDFAETKVTSDLPHGKGEAAESAPEGAPNILIVGSSYTDVLESLFVPSAHIMASLDYRDNKTGRSIASYVKEYDADYVIFIPNQRNESLSANQIRLHLGLDDPREP